MFTSTVVFCVSLVGAVLLERSSAILPCPDPFQGSRLRLRFLVDNTETMTRRMGQVTGPHGMMRKIMEYSDLAFSGANGVETSVTTFQDKEDAPPYGLPTDDCHTWIVKNTGSYSTIENIVLIPGGGGDNKNCQLQAMHRDIVDWGSGEDDVDNVFFLLTSTKAHTAEDGPAGYPPTPDTSSYEGNSVAYPEPSQIDKALLSKGQIDSKLIVVTEKDLQEYYRKLFKGSSQRVVVTHWRDTKEETFRAVYDALGEVFCTDGGDEALPLEPSDKIEFKADFGISAGGLEGGEKVKYKAGQKVSTLNLAANGKLVKKVKDAKKAKPAL